MRPRLSFQYTAKHRQLVFPLITTIHNPAHNQYTIHTPCMEVGANSALTRRGKLVGPYCIAIRRPHRQDNSTSSKGPNTSTAIYNIVSYNLYSQTINKPEACTGAGPLQSHNTTYPLPKTEEIPAGPITHASTSSRGAISQTQFQQ